MLNWILSKFKAPSVKKTAKRRNSNKIHYSNGKPIELSGLQQKAYRYLRENRPASMNGLKKHIGRDNLGSVIQALRKKGYPIDTDCTNHTYLIHNRRSK